MKKISYLLVVFLLTVSIGCETYRTIIPTITSSTRDGFSLKKPIYIAIKDSRGDQTYSAETIESLKTSLMMIYGSNVDFISYFDKTADGTVAIKINIKELGANFGSRMIVYQTVENQITVASAAVATYWGSAVSTVISSQPIYQNNLYAEGWWIGTTSLDVALVDNLHSTKNIYTFPFVGEDKQSNNYGYGSANTATQNSWNKVASGLLDLIDNVMLKVVEDQ